MKKTFNFNKVMNDVCNDLDKERKKHKKNLLEARKGKKIVYIAKVGNGYKWAVEGNASIYEKGISGNGKKQIHFCCCFFDYDKTIKDSSGAVAKKMEGFRKARIKITKQETKYLENAYKHKVF